MSESIWGWRGDERFWCLTSFDGVLQIVVDEAGPEGQPLATKGAGKRERPHEAQQHRPRPQGHYGHHHAPSLFPSLLFQLQHLWSSSSSSFLFFLFKKQKAKKSEVLVLFFGLCVCMWSLHNKTKQKQKHKSISQGNWVYFLFFSSLKESSSEEETKRKRKKRVQSFILLKKVPLILAYLLYIIVFSLWTVVWGSTPWKRSGRLQWRTGNWHWADSFCVLATQSSPWRRKKEMKEEMKKCTRKEEQELESATVIQSIQKEARYNNKNEEGDQRSRRRREEEEEERLSMNQKRRRNEQGCEIEYKRRNWEKWKLRERIDWLKSQKEFEEMSVLRSSQRRKRSVFTSQQPQVRQASP